MGFILALRGSVFPKSCLWALVSASIALVFHGHVAAESVGSALSSVWGSVLFVLGFLVVFRTQQAYSRFWEGATILQQVRGEWFNAASSVIAFSSTKKELLEDVDHFQSVFIRLMSLLYCTALQQVAVLADEQFEIINIEGMEDSALKYLASMSEQKTEVILQWIQRLVVEGMRSGVLDVPPPVLSRVFQELSRGIVSVVNAQKIMDTLFPFPYAQMITLLLLSTTFFTPFINCLLVTSRYWASATTFMTVFAFWSINYIAAEIELPFGDDPNDLPIRNLMHQMNKNLLMLLHKEAQAPPIFQFADEEKLHMFRSVSPAQKKTMSCPKVLAEMEPLELAEDGLSAPHRVHKGKAERRRSSGSTWLGCCSTCVSSWFGLQRKSVTEASKAEKRSSRAERRSISSMEIADKAASAVEPGAVHTPQHESVFVNAEEPPGEKAGSGAKESGKHVETHDTDTVLEPDTRLGMLTGGPSRSPPFSSGPVPMTHDVESSIESQRQASSDDALIRLAPVVPVANAASTANTRSPQPTPPQDTPSFLCALPGSAG